MQLNIDTMRNEIEVITRQLDSANLLGKRARDPWASSDVAARCRILRARRDALLSALLRELSKDAK